MPGKVHAKALRDIYPVRSAFKYTKDPCARGESGWRRGSASSSASSSASGYTGSNETCNRCEEPDGRQINNYSTRGKWKAIMMIKGLGLKEQMTENDDDANTLATNTYLDVHWKTNAAGR